MKISTKPAVLSTEEVREVVNTWSRQGFLRLRRLGDRMLVQEVFAHDCHAYWLTTQYEQRHVARVHVPYDGGEIDDVGRPPGFWDLPAHTPREFEDRVEHIPVPHTESLGVCPDCGGDGTVTCSTCGGWGKVNCTWSGGSGYRDRQEFRSDSTGGQAGGGSWVTVRENCTSCFGGKVNCTWCQGSGRLTCDGCTGGGKVKFFQQMTVTFHVVVREQAVSSADLPERLTLRADGDVLFDRTADRIDSFDPVSPEVDARAAEALQESRDAEGPEQRLLFQRLRVEAVPVHEVTYTHGGPKVRRLWIYGRERRVHAPGAPWRWLLLTTLIVAGAVLAAGGIAAAVWALAPYFQ